MSSEPQPRFVQHVVLVDPAPRGLRGAHNLVNSLSVPRGVALDDGDVIPGLRLTNARLDFQDAFCATLRAPAEIVVVEPITDTNHAIFIAGHRVITPPLDTEPVREVAGGEVTVRAYVRGVVTRTARRGEIPPPEPAAPAQALEGDVVAHQDEAAP